MINQTPITMMNTEKDVYQKFEEMVGVPFKSQYYSGWTVLDDYSNLHIKQGGEWMVHSKSVTHGMIDVLYSLFENSVTAVSGEHELQILQGLS